jgi:hypothetical protein
MGVTCQVHWGVPDADGCRGVQLWHREFLEGRLAAEARRAERRSRCEVLPGLRACRHSSQFGESGSSPLLSVTQAVGGASSSELSVEQRSNKNN